MGLGVVRQGLSLVGGTQLNPTPWYLLTLMVYTVTWVLVVSAGLPRAVPGLTLHSGLTLALWWYATRPRPLYEVTRRCLPLVWFFALVAGFGLYGNWLYPGIFPPGTGAVERLASSLTTPGWVAAGVVTPFCLAAFRLAAAVIGLRQYHWPRGGPAEWLRLRWPAVVMGANSVAAWWLLRPYAPMVGASDAVTWARALVSRGAWPAPLPVLQAIGILLAWSVMV